MVYAIKWYVDIDTKNIYTWFGLQAKTLQYSFQVKVLNLSQQKWLQTAAEWHKVKFDFFFPLVLCGSYIQA